MKFGVLVEFKIKTEKGLIELKQGQTLEMDATKASKLITEGKIKAIGEPKPPPEPTQRDLELEKAIGKPDMNPNRYPCVKCGKLAGRYCLGLVHDRLWWAWWCLECRLYTEPERN